MKDIGSPGPERRFWIAGPVRFSYQSSNLQQLRSRSRSRLNSLDGKIWEGAKSEPTMTSARRPILALTPKLPFVATVAAARPRLCLDSLSRPTPNSLPALHCAVACTPSVRSMHGQSINQGGRPSIVKSGKSSIFCQNSKGYAFTYFLDWGMFYGKDREFPQDNNLHNLL